MKKTALYSIRSIYIFTCYLNTKIFIFNKTQNTRQLIIYGLFSLTIFLILFELLDPFFHKLVKFEYQFDWRVVAKKISSRLTYMLCVLLIQYVTVLSFQSEILSHWVILLISFTSSTILTKLFRHGKIKRWIEGDVKIKEP